MQFLNSDITVRLQQVCQSSCSRETFISIYGLDLWGASSEAAGRFRVWADDCGKPNVLTANAVDRWAFELFLQQEHLMPKKNAAIYFAMSEEDFSRVVEAMCNHSLVSQSIRVELASQLFSTSFINDLDKHFKTLRLRFYSSQSEFIHVFHETIRQQLNVEVSTIYSACSKLLNEKPLDVATEFDVLTGEPLGNRHQVWLEFHKPLALRPDACSIVTFARYQDSLKAYCPYPLDPQELELIHCCA